MSAYSDTDLPDTSRRDVDDEPVRTFSPLIEAYMALLALLVGFVKLIVDLLAIPFRESVSTEPVS